MRHKTQLLLKMGVHSSTIITCYGVLYTGWPQKIQQVLRVLL